MVSRLTWRSSTSGAADPGSSVILLSPKKLNRPGRGRGRLSLSLSLWPPRGFSSAVGGLILFLRGWRWFRGGGVQISRRGRRVRRHAWPSSWPSEKRVISTFFCFRRYHVLVGAARLADGGLGRDRPNKKGGTAFISCDVPSQALPWAPLHCTITHQFSLPPIPVRFPSCCFFHRPFPSPPDLTPTPQRMSRVQYSDTKGAPPGPEDREFVASPFGKPWCMEARDDPGSCPERNSYCAFVEA